jgi:hypothetical protein
MARVPVDVRALAAAGNKKAELFVEIVERMERRRLMKLRQEIGPELLDDLGVEFDLDDLTGKVAIPLVRKPGP